jgi:hypothetical protein
VWNTQCRSKHSVDLNGICSVQEWASGSVKLENWHWIEKHVIFL